MSDQLAISFDAPPLDQAIRVGTAAMHMAEDRAEREHPGFADEAQRFITRFARTSWKPFSSEEVVALARACGLVPADERAWGGAFQRAARAGVIRRSSETYPRKKGHGTLAFKWERA